LIIPAVVSSFDDVLGVDTTVDVSNSVVAASESISAVKKQSYIKHTNSLMQYLGEFSIMHCPNFSVANLEKYQTGLP